MRGQDVNINWVTSGLQDTLCLQVPQHLHTPTMSAKPKLAKLEFPATNNCGMEPRWG